MPANVVVVAVLSQPVRGLVEELIDLALLTEAEFYAARKLGDPTPKLSEMEVSTRAARLAAGEQVQEALTHLTQPAHAKAALLTFRQSVQDRARCVLDVLAAFKEELASRPAEDGPILWQPTQAPPGNEDFSTLRGLAVSRLLHDGALRSKGYVALNKQYQNWNDGLKALERGAADLDQATTTTDPVGLLNSWKQNAQSYRKALPRGGPFAQPGALVEPTDIREFLQSLKPEVESRLAATRAEHQTVGKRLRAIENTLARETLIAARKA
jgi:hypothetical protein